MWPLEMSTYDDDDDDGRLCCAECIYMSFFGTIFIIILLHNKVENHHRTYTQVLKLNLKKHKHLTINCILKCADIGIV